MIETICLDEGFKYCRFFVFWSEISIKTLIKMLHYLDGELWLYYLPVIQMKSQYNNKSSSVLELLINNSGRYKHLYILV